MKMSGGQSKYKGHKTLNENKVARFVTYQEGLKMQPIYVNNLHHTTVIGLWSKQFRNVSINVGE
jgi:hypothetical protein